MNYDIHDDVAEAANLLEQAIICALENAAKYESRLSGAIIPTGADLAVTERITYYYGVESGLNQALFILRAVQA